MNPEQEHLDKIVAKCRANLALAEKRTPGEWHLSKNGSAAYAGTDQVCYCGNYPADADYIASCAGAAEAGWKSTIAAIEFLLAKGEPGELEIEDEQLIGAILAAWPKELL